jgi:hypothetical protein
VKVRPILFNGEMVRAILEGRKTQTRRVIKDFPEYHKGTEAPQAKRGEPPRHPSSYFDCYCNKPRTEANPRGMSDRWCWWDEYDRMGNGWLKCPFGVPGDRLWVRETWGDGEENNCEPGVYYRATDPAWDKEETGFRWKPSIHMPRWASRISLEVTGVRVERLNDISEADAEAEGASKVLWFCPAGKPECRMNLGKDVFDISYINGFANVWESINGPGSWAENPWVWVLEFKRIEVPA